MTSVQSRSDVMCLSCYFLGADGVIYPGQSTKYWAGHKLPMFWSRLHLHSSHNCIQRLLYVIYKLISHKDGLFCVCSNISQIEAWIEAEEYIYHGCNWVIMDLLTSMVMSTLENVITWLRLKKYTNSILCCWQNLIWASLFNQVHIACSVLNELFTFYAKLKQKGHKQYV